MQPKVNIWEYIKEAIIIKYNLWTYSFFECAYAHNKYIFVQSALNVRKCWFISKNKSIKPSCITYADKNRTKMCKLVSRCYLKKKIGITFNTLFFFLMSLSGVMFPERWMWEALPWFMKNWKSIHILHITMFLIAVTVIWYMLWSIKELKSILASHTNLFFWLPQKINLEEMKKIKLSRYIL